MKSRMYYRDLDFEQFRNAILEETKEWIEYVENSYTPSNLEQIYKHNKEKTLIEISYVLYHTNSIENAFELIKNKFEEISEYLKHKKNKPEAISREYYGILDTYYWVLDTMFYNKNVERFLYQSGKYCEIKEKLLIL